MFLLFELRRPDVWPVDDLGVRTGWALVHELETAPTARQLEPLGEAFPPYRSTAAWLCWQAVHVARGDVDDRSVRTARRYAFRILTVLFGVASFGGLFGVGIVIGWYDTTEGGIHRVHDLGFGILFGVILTTAFLAMARRPETKPSVFLQVVAVAAASLLAGAVAQAVGYVVIGIIVAAAAAILLALHPDRTGVLHPAARPSPVLGALAVVGSVPLIWYAVITAGLQRNGLPADPHVEQGHWVTMSAMAFGLVLVGLLASAQIRGWRLTAWCSGVGIAVFGLASIVFRESSQGRRSPTRGDKGMLWGIVALIGGLLFVTAAE